MSSSIPPHITSVTPIDYPNQRIFKIDGKTNEASMIGIRGSVYINSLSLQYLTKVAQILGLENPEYIDIRGRERQHENLTGHLLESGYSNIVGGTRSFKALLRTHAQLVNLLNTESDLKKAA